MESNMAPTVSSEARFKLYLTGMIYDATDQFYSNVLLFPVVHRWDNSPQDRGVMFDMGSAIIELIDNGQQYAPIGGCGLSLAIPNVQALWHYLNKAKASVGPLRNRPWGDTDFTITDPSGFPLTFFTPTKFLQALVAVHLLGLVWI